MSVCVCVCVCMLGKVFHKTESPCTASTFSLNLTPPSNGRCLAVQAKEKEKRSYHKSKGAGERVGCEWEGVDGQPLGHIQFLDLSNGYVRAHVIKIYEIILLYIIHFL